MNILGTVLRVIVMAITSFFSSRAMDASAEEVKTQQDDSGGIRG